MNNSSERGGRTRTAVVTLIIAYVIVLRQWNNKQTNGTISQDDEPSHQRDGWWLPERKLISAMT